MKVNEIITEEIITLLERGEVPWRKPWSSGGWPKNIVSKKEYTGINVFLLGCREFGSPYWATFKQVEQLKGKVKKGAKSAVVCFAKQEKYEDKETGEENTRFILRYYRVFNLEQVEGIEDPDADKNGAREFNPIEEAEKIVAGFKDKPEITTGPAACYRPMSDQIEMPAPERFTGEAEYYSTLFHELTHATGHQSRLAREEVTKGSNFGSNSYGREELVAEMGAAFLCGRAGVSAGVIENQAAYIASWLQVIRGDKSMVIRAAAAAQRAYNYITNQE